MIFLSSLFILIEGFYASFFGFILEAFQSYFNCSDFYSQLIPGLNLLGIGLGSSSTGFLPNKIPRLNIIY
jgi:hypothetical protein